MDKQKVFLHVGPALPAVARPHAALRDSPALAAVGLAAPPVDQADMDRADIEIRRRHRALGMRRKEVEGAWAEICRRSYRLAGSGRHVVLSQPGFLTADFHQTALALDALVGMRLHLVVTPTDGRPVALGEWRKFVKDPARLHVLPLAPDTGPEAFARAIARLAAATDRGAGAGSSYADTAARRSTDRRRPRTARDRAGLLRRIGISAAARRPRRPSVS